MILHEAVELHGADKVLGRAEGNEQGGGDEVSSLTETDVSRSPYGGKRRVSRFHGLDFMVGNNGYGVFYALFQGEFGRFCTLLRGFLCCSAHTDCSAESESEDVRRGCTLWRMMLFLKRGLENAMRARERKISSIASAV
mgnify:CR=1 FL=1